MSAERDANYDPQPIMAAPAPTEIPKEILGTKARPMSADLDLTEAISRAELAERAFLAMRAERDALAAKVELLMAARGAAEAAIAGLISEARSVVVERDALRAAVAHYEAMEHVGYWDSAGYLPLPSLPVSAEDQRRFFQRARPLFAAVGEGPEWMSALDG